MRLIASEALILPSGFGRESKSDGQRVLRSRSSGKIWCVSRASRLIICYVGPLSSVTALCKQP